MSHSRYLLWVEALSSVRTRADAGPHRAAKYRVRGIPAEYDIRIVKRPQGAGWFIDRGDGESQGATYETPDEALRALQQEFDARHRDG